MAAVPFLPSATRSGAADGLVVVPRVRAGRRTVVGSYRWGRVLPVLPVLVGIGALVPNRGTLVRAIDRVASLGPRELVLVLAVLLAQKAATATVHHGATVGVSWRRAALASEAYLGASNAMIGGSGLGTGVRVAMLRSWGVDALDAASAVLLTAVLPSVALWAIAVAHTAPSVVLGRADGLSTLIMVAGLFAVTVPLLVGRHVLGDPRRLVRPAARLERIRTRLIEPSGTAGRLSALRVRLRAGALGRIDLVGGAERLHDRVSRTCRRRAARVMIAAVGAQVLTGLLLVVCVRALAPSGSGVDALALLRAYALLRVAASFVPLPGGIGVLDLGLLGVLSRAGVDRATAIAALGVFRGLTFALPLVTGPLATVWWQATHDRRAADALRRS